MPIVVEFLENMEGKVKESCWRCVKVNVCGRLVEWWTQDWRHRLCRGVGDCPLAAAMDADSKA